jgi:hypothetical protein
MPRLAKAITTGFAAVAIAAAATSIPLVVTILKYRASFSPPSGAGHFVVVHWHIWPTLGVSLLVFAATFFWQYRRSASPSSLQ